MNLDCVIDVIVNEICDWYQPYRMNCMWLSIFCVGCDIYIKHEILTGVCLDAHCDHFLFGWFEWENVYPFSILWNISGDKSFVEQSNKSFIGLQEFRQPVKLGGLFKYFKNKGFNELYR